MNKQFLSALLALAMAAAMAVPALANGSPDLPAGDTLGGVTTTPDRFADTSLPKGLALDAGSGSGPSAHALPDAVRDSSVTLRLYMNGSGSLTTQTMSWRDALAGILSGESGGLYGRFDDNAVLQAWAAQAVAIHSYLLYNNCNTGTATSEVWRDPGTGAKGQLLYRAADMALDYIAVAEINASGSHTDPNNYNIALTTYYASAGMNPQTGARGTANSQDVWVQALPYLQGVASPYDQEIAEACGDRWERYPQYNYTRWEELTSGLQKLYGITVSRDQGENALRVSRYSTYGYVPHDGLSVGGHSGLDGQKLYTGFYGTNWSVHLSSGSYRIDYIPGHTEYESNLGRVEEPWHLVAYGNGHGVGLSQYGSMGYAAKNGWSAWQILAHYYPGVRLYNKANGTFYEPSESSAVLRPLVSREPGDILDDGGFTLGDLLALAGHLQGAKPLTDPVQLALADMDGNGIVNAADLRMLAARLLE